jgi:hypothetical protein
MRPQADEQEKERRAEARSTLQRLREKRAAIDGPVRGKRNGKPKPGEWSLASRARRPRMNQEGQPPIYRLSEVEPEETGSL